MKSEYEVEFRQALTQHRTYLSDMRRSLEGYNTNFYYPRKPNSPKNTNDGVNLVRVFADKAWNYLSPFPKISVPVDPLDKPGSSKREKLLYTVHQQNKMEQKWAKGAFFGTVLSGVVITLDFDLKKRCVLEEVVDPRFCVWQSSDLTGDEIDTLWTVKPMTAIAIKRKFGVDVKAVKAEALQPLDIEFVYEDLSPVEDERYLVVKRFDAEKVVLTIGGVEIKKYNHLMGLVPFEVILPINIASNKVRGDFYLLRLAALQAEFNDLWRKRSAIVARLGAPTVWGRGVNQKTIDALKQSTIDGGFIGLKETGELGLLSIPETSMIDNALENVFQRMKDVAGFPTATFGEIAGANTSGDALGMYFQPTTRMIEHQNIAYRNGLKRINAKILQLYSNFLLPGEMVQLNGVLPTGRYAMTPEGMQYGGSFNDIISKEEIGQKFQNEVTSPAVTPKDDLGYKRLMLDFARDGVISRTTAYDEIGLLSPQDELEQLTSEQSQPALNPQGTTAIMSGALQAQQLANGGVTDAPQGL
jgi:hypothetical protein